MLGKHKEHYYNTKAQVVSNFKKKEKKGKKVFAVQALFLRNFGREWRTLIFWRDTSVKASFTQLLPNLPPRACTPATIAAQG